MGVVEYPRKRIIVRVFIIIMLAYSAKKNMSNVPAAYSTLKPNASVDSPSVRSKGAQARLISARVEINRLIIARGRDRKIINKCSCWELGIFLFGNLFVGNLVGKIIRKCSCDEG